MKGHIIKALAGLLGSASVLAAGCLVTETPAGNRVLVERFVDQFYTRRDVAGAFHTFVVDDYIQHNPGLADGRDAAQSALAPMFAAPGAQFDVKHVLIDGDMALVHLFGRGDPKTSGAAVADLYRLNSGRVVEHWDVIQPIVAGTDPLARNQLPAAPTETDRNRAVMRHFVDALYRDKRVDFAYRNFVAPNFTEHSPGRPAGREAAIKALRPLFESANASFSIEHLLIDGNFAAVHYRGRIDATGPGAAVVELFRLQNGKIVEHWDVYQPIPQSSKNAHPMF